MASGDASLAGAEFTFRYYDGQYATSAEAEASGAPTRTWVFKTNEKGRIRIMDESLKVSGDDLFYNSMGQITLPIGTLLIQETKAPEGYLIDPTVYVRNITPDGTLEAVNSYNAPTVSEQVVTGRIQIVKHTDTGTTKVETPEVGATFNIYLASAGSYDAAPANAKAQLTIDKDGFAVSPDLPYGLYTVEQTSGWEGSRLMEPFTVKIDENGKTYSYIINNERFYSYLKVVKVDAITGEAIPAAGVGFQIIDPKGQKLEWWGADTWYTDGSGVMKLPCELEYGRGYQAVEVVAPSGYVLADKPFLFDVLPENAAQEDGLTVITLTAPNSPTQISVAKVDEQGTFVSGATLQLMDAAGNVAAEWVTENLQPVFRTLHDFLPVLRRLSGAALPLQQGTGQLGVHCGAAAGRPGRIPALCGAGGGQCLIPCSRSCKNRPGHGVSVACRSSASSSCWAICFSFQPVFLCRSITRM